MNIYQKHKARLKHELITNQTHEEDEETIAKYNACEIAEEIDKKILSTMFNEKE